MSEKDNGGPAFPMRPERREPITKDMEMVTPGEWPGMTLRDYFIAHAPADPWPIFEPVMLEPRPISGPWKSDYENRFFASRFAAEKECGEDFHCVNQKALDAWDAERKYAWYAQWPAFWADAMLAERAK